MDRRLAIAGFAVALLVLWVGAIAPYRDLIGLYPVGQDAMRWVTAPHPETEGGWRWILTRPHFVGYRPVAAFTYGLDGLIWGWNPVGWRTTDLVLHALAGTAVGFGLRALTGLGWGWALLASGLFWLHPVAGAVVPFVARRSYALATALSLLAVAALARSCDDRGRGADGWAGLAGLALLAALLSNEMAYGVVPVLPLLGWRSPSGSRVRARRWAPSAVAVAAAMALRVAVLGELTGGYRRPVASVMVEGRRRMVAVDAGPVDRFLDALGWLLAPTGAQGEAALLGGLAVAGIAGWALAWSSHTAWRDPGPHRLVPLTLVLWLAALAAIVGWSGTWSWRQAYPMAAVLALWVALGIHRVVHTRGPAWGHAVPIGLLLVAQLVHSPVMWGLDRDAVRGRFRATRAVHQVERHLKTVPGPAHVWLALRLTGSTAGAALHWVEIRHRHRPLTFELLALASRDHMPDRRSEALVLDAGTARLGEGMRWASAVGQELGLTGDALVLTGLPARGQPETWLLAATEARWTRLRIE